MGLFSDLRTLDRQAKEIRKGYDPVAQAHAGLASMRAAREAMESATRVGTSTAARPDVATVLSVTDTGLVINGMPVAELGLLVDAEGRPPFPAQVRCGIPLGAAGQAERGALVSVRTVGDSVAVLWGAPVG